jgi:hypothetical protein
MLQCCAHTLLRLADSNPRADYGDGATVMCRSGNSSHKLILFNGIWRWVNPLDATAEERDRLRKGGQLYDHIRGRNRG